MNKMCDNSYFLSEDPTFLGNTLSDERILVDLSEMQIVTVAIFENIYYFVSELLE